jgi:antitoxin component YwqK of YwqJK toxin-antitoxin module
MLTLVVGLGAAATSPAPPEGRRVVVIERYASGSLKSITPTLDGRRDGIVREWYESGLPRTELGYARGEKTGRHRTWWPTGSLREVGLYWHDARVDEYRAYYSSGAPYERRHYASGHEAGLQQSWSEDGALFLNYEVRDGRRYGFVNAKPCLPS